MAPLVWPPVWPRRTRGSFAQHRGHLEVDAVVVGYPGHFLVPFGRVLAAFRHTRLVFDPLVSLWDTFAGDRGLVAAGGWKAAAVRAVDRAAFALPSLVLADTWAHAAYYQETFGLARRKLVVAPVGALPVAGADGAARSFGHGEPLTVLQYGKWSPLHGAETVLAAAELLRAEPFRFVLAGEGQLSGALRAEIARRGLANVEWLGALSPAELRAHTLAADICLGVFGGSDKAARVVPNKVYDALACGRPVVTADSDGAREWLRDGETALLTPAGDAAALAAALRRLLDERERTRLGRRRSACTGGPSLRRGRRRVAGRPGGGVTAEGATPKPSSRRRLILRIVQAVIVAATVYFLAAYLVRSWGSIKNFDWEFDAGWLALSGAAFLVFYFAQAWFWWLLLRGCGAVSPFWPAASVWAKSILARYVPGNVFMFVGRAWMSHSQGLAVERVSAAMVYEQALGVVRRPPRRGRPLPLLGVPPGPYGVQPDRRPRAGHPHAPRVFGPLAGFALRLFRRPPLEVTLGFGAVLGILCLFTVDWLIAGTGAWLLARAITGLGVGALPLVIVANALAYVVGMAAFVFPSGIGVREAVFTASLAKQLPGGVALAWALLLRVWVTVVELVFVGLVVGHRARRAQEKEA